MTRFVATARVSKHCLFTFADATAVPSEQVVAMPLDSWTVLSVLQSRVHGLWVQLMATRMGAGIRYSASECFETFPFPAPDPRTVLPDLESIPRTRTST